MQMPYNYYSTNLEHMADAYYIGSVVYPELVYGYATFKPSLLRFPEFIQDELLRFHRK